MTDDLRDLLRRVDTPKRPAPASDTRIRAAIEIGLQQLLDGTGEERAEEVILIDEDEDDFNHHPQLGEFGRTRWLAYAAAVLLAAGTLTLAAIQRGDDNELATGPPTTTVDNSLAAGVPEFCRQHIDPIRVELETWNGTYYYLYAHQSEVGGPLTAALQVAVDDLVSLDQSAGDLRDMVLTELEHVRGSGLAQRNVHLKNAISALAAHLRDLPGSAGCRLGELERATESPGPQLDTD